jgi:tripartite-type tricarboxylate transporter receptor subunit TctC
MLRAEEGLTMNIVRFVGVLALLVFSVGGAPTQAAEGKFPERPLRYIIPFPPGGSTDIVGRIVADALTRTIGQQVIIDNRGGAGGTLGATIAARATPDGYTLFACNIASLAVSPALYRKLSYDPVAGFDPVGLIGSNPNTLVIHPSVPAKTVGEFIKHVKSRPGKLNYASAGVGTSPQLSMEMFKLNSGTDIVHVAYKGGGPAVAALIGGHVQASFGTVPSFLGAIRAGQVHSLAVTSKTRAPDLPDVPTLAESGMPDFEVVSWQGLCTPAGVPKANLSRVRSALSEALALPITGKRLADQGIQLTPLAPEKFAAFIRAERDKYAKVVNAIGIPKL